MKENRSTNSRNKRNGKQASKPRSKQLSPYKCPDGMSQKDWQIALRRQIVEKERLVVIAPDDSDYFTVKNPRTSHSYQVFYKGARSKWNFCSCYDFCTNQLGTCKHVEAITLSNGGAYAQKRYSMPDYSTVYLDYRGARIIKIRIGTHKKTDFQQLAERYFDKDGVLLDESYDCFESFMHQAREIDHRFKVYDDALDFIIEKREARRRTFKLAEESDDTFANILKDTRLYNYQIEGVKFAVKSGRSLNADEMGLGKTIQALATAEYLKNNGFIDSVLILCPTSLKYQWLNEIRRFTDSSVTVVEGNPIARKMQMSDNSFYKVCSYNSLSNDIKGGETVTSDMVIYDEVQRLKNWDTQISRNIKRVKSHYALALSGTPLENKLTELYSVMNFVDPFCLGPFYKFNELTTVYDETGRVVGYKNLNQVKETLKNVMIRRRKSEVALEMPGRTDTNLFVPLTKEQSEIHNEYKLTVARLVQKWRHFRFLSESDRRRLLLSLSMMRMVCDSTFVIDQKSRHDTKIDEAIYFVKSISEEGDRKIVIFSQWERMLRIMAETLEKNDIKYCFLHGGVPSRKRKSLIDAFQSDAETRVFLSTDAGSTGLNLQAASVVINFDMPWNPAVLEQRIARAYRLGQEHPVQIINMVTRGTIEENMLGTLKFKSGLFDGVLDNGEDSLFIEQNKFDKILEFVDSNIVPDGVDAANEIVVVDDDSEETPRDQRVSTDSDTDSHEKTERSEHTTADGDDERPDSVESAEKTIPAATAQTIDGEQLVAQGITFLSGLADALKTPESTKKLVDSMLRTDKKTGRTTLSIPVPNKDTLTTLLTALGTLLNRQ